MNKRTRKNVMNMMKIKTKKNKSKVTVIKRSTLKLSMLSITFNMKITWQTDIQKKMKRIKMKKNLSFSSIPLNSAKDHKIC